MDLEVIVPVKAVKWHQNTAASKLKLNFCVILKTQITLRLRKEQKSSPYHCYVFFFPKSKMKLLDENILLKGKKLGFSNKNIMVSLGNLDRHQECPAVQPPTPSDILAVPDGLYYRMTSPLFFYYDLWVTNYL